MDVTATERPAEVERLGEELREANSARTGSPSFHELRNPLAAILAGVELVQRLVPTMPAAHLGITNATPGCRQPGERSVDLSRIARGRCSSNARRPRLQVEAAVDRCGGRTPGHDLSKHSRG